MFVVVGVELCVRGWLVLYRFELGKNSNMVVIHDFYASKQCTRPQIY